MPPTTSGQSYDIHSVSHAPIAHPAIPPTSVNIRTGLVTASDQQGQYIPSTPLHIVRDRQFYGFLAPFQPKEKYPAPIADPLTWIPHMVNASAISQTWLYGAKMGPLNDALMTIQPESAEAAARWQEYLSSWMPWNHVRTVAGIASLALFILGFRG